MQMMGERHRYRRRAHSGQLALADRSRPQFDSSLISILRRLASTVTAHYHVTSVLNRLSIITYGLDWTRMGAAPGIAGSRRPEQQGSFLVGDEFDVDWFVGINNTGGAVDVWGVRGIDVDELVQSPEGYFYFPGVIPPERVWLIKSDLSPRAR